MNQAYRYSFTARVPLQEAIESLYLAIFAAEGVHGRAQVRLDAGYAFDERARLLAVDAGTPVGKTVSQIFTSLLARQFGEEAFTVEHIATSSAEGQAR
jgi:hypothetical protein